MRVALLCTMAFVAVTCVVATRPAPQGLEPTLAHKPVHPRLPADANAGAGLEIQNRDWTRSVYRGVERVVDDATPSQVRLAFIPAGISVSWSMAAAQSPMQAVSYGLNPSSLTNNVYATEESTYGSLFFYTALLPNLSPATRYYYQIEGAPAVGSFVTGRTAGDPTQFTTLVVGDMGLDNSPNTIAQMKANMDSTDFYLHIGDLSYADDYYLRWNNTYEGSWDAWQDEMEPMTSAVPYMSLPGNHEVTCTEVTPFLCPTFQRNFTAYRNRFRMPWRESGGVDNLWYSYDYGLAHFIQIDTETDYPNSKMGPGTFYNAGPFGDQVSWFEADLQKAALAKEKGTIAWIVVSGHRPWYSSAGKCDSCQAAFEALMLQYGVDVYFSGHVHWYERMWPLAAGGVITQQNYNSPKGIVYIVNGAAGNVEGLTGSTTPLPYSATIDDTDFGFGKLTVFNSSAMGWEYFKATDGSLVDQILITK